MEFTEMKNLLLQLQQTDYRNFVKALVAIETNCNDEEKLESLYEKFMEEDEVSLLGSSVLLFMNQFPLMKNQNNTRLHLVTI